MNLTHHTHTHTHDEGHQNEILKEKGKKNNHHAHPVWSESIRCSTYVSCWIFVMVTFHFHIQGSTPHWAMDGIDTPVQIVCITMSTIIH